MLTSRYISHILSWAFLPPRPSCKYNTQLPTFSSLLLFPLLDSEVADETLKRWMGLLMMMLDRDVVLVL